MRCKVFLKKQDTVNEYQLILLPELSLLAQLQKNKIPIASSCGGFGTCGTCQISVLSGLAGLEPLDELELEWQRDRGHQSNQRLSCQCILGELSKTVGDLIIQIEDQS